MNIIHYPDPRLLSRTNEVSEIDDEVRAQVERMFELMYESEGVGLAAPQVASDRRLFIMNPSGQPDRTEDEWVVLNPKILKRKGRAFGAEGCLSLPGIQVDIERSVKVVVEFTDLDGETQKMSLTDFEARVFQHELDHLDGVLIIHRMTEADRIQTRAAVEKMERDAHRA